MTSLAVLLVIGTASGQVVKKFHRTPTAKSAGTVLTGTITDSRCRTAMHDPAMHSAAECIRHCAQSGSKFAFVSDGKVYTLQGARDELMKFAGQQVSIRGQLNAYDLTVDAITPVAMAAKK